MLPEELIRKLCSEKAQMPFLSDKEFEIHEPILFFVIGHNGPFNNDFHPEFTNIDVAIFGMALDIKEELCYDVDISLSQKEENRS